MPCTLITTVAIWESVPHTIEQYLKRAHMQLGHTLIGNIQHLTIRNEAWRSRGVDALLAICALLLLLFHFKSPFNFYDEGFAVYSGARVLNGDLPYSDFWVVYPPGQSYALAALFRAFGTSLLVSRGYDTFVRFVIACSVWLIAKKLSNRSLAHVAFIAAALLLGSVGFFSYAVFPALALSLLSVLGLLEYFESGRRCWLLLAGTLIGFTAFFRWDIALYAVTSILASVFLFHFVRATRKIRRLGIEITLILAGTLAVMLVSFGYVGAVSGLGNLWYQVVVFPTTTLRNVRWMPYPALLSPFLVLSVRNISDFWSIYPQLLSWLGFYLPLTLYGVALFSYAYSIAMKRAVVTAQLFGGTAVAIFGLLAFAQALSRYDEIHTLPSALMVPLVVLPLLSGKVLNAMSRAMKLVVMILLPMLVILYVVIPVQGILTDFRHFPPLGCYSHLKRASCVSVRNDQEQAVAYIRKQTKPRDAIFVGNRITDLSYVNDIGFYFLSSRQSASHYDGLYPGVAMTLAVQQEIAHEIESKDVRWIVLLDGPSSQEPNDSAKDAGTGYLDDFVRARYSPVAEYGDYQILEAATR